MRNKNETFEPSQTGPICWRMSASLLFNTLFFVVLITLSDAKGSFYGTQRDSMQIFTLWVMTLLKVGKCGKKCLLTMWWSKIFGWHWFAVQSSLLSCNQTLVGIQIIRVCLVILKQRHSTRGFSKESSFFSKLTISKQTSWRTFFCFIWTRS